MTSNKTKSELERINDMQGLHTEVARDVQAIQAMVNELPEIKKRADKLQMYYQTQWQEDEETITKDDSALEAHQHLVPEGEYSILGQDTLWNTFEEYADANKALLKAIVELV